MSLTLKQKKSLRNLAHSRKPVVIIGQHGLGENVIGEIDQALEHHELVKVRVNAADRAQRGEFIERICKATGAELVQRIGHIAVLYRRHPTRPRIPLSAEH